MEFQARGTAECGLSFGPYGRAKLVQFLKDNPGARFTLKAVLPESRKMRGWVEGGLIPLVTFYQEGMDHRDYKDNRTMREALKVEFNADIVKIGDHVQRVAKSTEGREALKAFAERILDWLTEQYAPPAEALDPARYKIWRDTIFPYGGPSDYISYLVEIGLLKSPQ